MNTSLRDQLLKAGLISKKQANEVERQSQRQERPVHPKHKQHSKPTSPHAEPTLRADTTRSAPVAKTVRDRELNRRQQEKAETKARLAQIKQLIDQHRLAETPGPGGPGHEGPGVAGPGVGAPDPASRPDQFYNFVDGAKIRRIQVDDTTRDKLVRGEIVIVKFNARYELVPAAIATRIGERDPRCILNSSVPPGGANSESAYEGHPVPDDLIW
jgi:uncharacterized protein YaiL (DUF2058 family)